MNIDRSFYEEELARIGQELRNTRESSRIRIDEIASALGVSASTISKIEHGKMNISVGYLIALARVYGLELSLNGVSRSE